MANDGKIYITISDNRSAKGTEAEINNISEKKEKESNLQRSLFNTADNFVKSQAKQFVNYSLNNIGNFTGNYQTQRDINAMTSLVNTAIGIGSAFARFGVAGGIVAVAGVGINYAYQDYSLYVANNQQNRAISMVRDLSGMNALLDGSRGTQG